MRYIIFGAGRTGKTALIFLGGARVDFFVDNDRNKTEFCGKQVMDFDTFRKMDLSDYITVVASKLYGDCLEKQLLDACVTRYFAFCEEDIMIHNQLLPRMQLNMRWEPVSYNLVLANKGIEQYKKIAILGVNALLPYLISEIAIQSNCFNVSVIISNEKIEAETCMGIPVRTWEDADKDIDCLVVNVEGAYPGLSDILETINDSIKVIDIYDPAYGNLLFYHPELAQYKDIHKGKRIWLIGNGPSMNIDDLEKLHESHEICIACNRIYKIYNKTSWRADYLILDDPLIAQGSKTDLPNILGDIIMSDRCNAVYGIPRYESVKYIHIIDYCDDKGHPKFSEDVCMGTYGCGTVIYSVGLQLAAYMGAGEIYLIGVDNTYTGNVTDSQNHFIENYFNSEEKKRYENARLHNQRRSELAFEKAEIHSQKRGFRIYNATRGGAVEAFERVDFDSLF